MAWSDGDFATPTNLNNKSTSAFVNVLDATYGATGDGSTDDTTAISAAVTAAANKTLLFPPGTYVISDDITIPATVQTLMLNNANVSIASGKTLTINGPFSAGAYQTFAGSGSAAFGAGAVSEILVAWFGDNTTTAPIQAAVDAAPTTGATILFTTDTHTITISSTIGVRVDKNYLTFKSNCFTEFVPDGSDVNGLWFSIGSDSSDDSFVRVNDIRFEGLKFTGSATATSTNQIGVSVKPPSTNYAAKTAGCFNITVTNCFFRGFTSCVACTGAAGVHVYGNDMGSNVFITAAVAGGYCVLLESCYDSKVHHNRFIGASEDRHAIYVSIDGNNSGTIKNKNVIIDHNFAQWTSVTTLNNNFKPPFQCTNTDALNVHGNILLDPIQYGISFTCGDADGTDYIISENNILGIRNATGGTTGGGVVFIADTDDEFIFSDVLVTNNRITEASSGASNSYGVQISGVSGGLVDGNVIDLYGTAGIGVLVSEATDITVGSNRVNCNSGARSGLAFAGDATARIMVDRQVVNDPVVAEIEAINSVIVDDLQYNYSVNTQPTGTESGVTGQTAWFTTSGASYFYVCTSGDSWMRAALDPF